MNEIVIICTSYDTIKDTLLLAAHNHPKKSITIIAANKYNLFKFFQVINEKVFQNSISLIFLEPYQSGRGASRGIFRKAFNTLKDIIRERRYLKNLWDKYFTEVQGDEVFFTTRVVSGYLFFLLRKLSMRNKLLYVHSYTSLYLAQFHSYIPTNISDFAYFIIRKLNYGRDIAMARITAENISPDNKGILRDGLPYVPDRFMVKAVSRVIEMEEMNRMEKDFDFEKFCLFDVTKYRVIYFDSPLMATPLRREGLIIDPDDYKKVLNDVFKVLLRYFPEKEIARKYHPNHPADKEIVTVGDVIPDFIPAEFLYNEDVKMYISIYSESISNVENGVVVSIADLFTYQDEKFKEQYYKLFTKSNRTEILFPKSLDEFDKILANLAQGMKTG